MIAGATEQLSEVGEINGKGVRVEVPFLAGWLLEATETVPSRKELATVAGVEIPLATVGATPEMVALSKGNVDTVGIVRELLRSSLAWSGLAKGSVLMIEAGEITPRGEAVAAAGLTTCSGSTRLLFAKVASGQRDISREDDVLCRVGGF